MSQTRFNTFMDAARRIDDRINFEDTNPDFFNPEGYETDGYYSTINQSLIDVLDIWDGVYFEYLDAAFKQLPNKDSYPGGMLSFVMDSIKEDYSTLSKKVELQWLK